MKNTDPPSGDSDDAGRTPLQPSSKSSASALPSGLFAPQAERYASLFERVPIGLYCTTPDGRVLDGCFADGGEHGRGAGGGLEAGSEADGV